MTKLFSVFGMLAILALIGVFVGCSDQSRSPLETSYLEQGQATNSAQPASGEAFIECDPNPCTPFVTDLWAGAGQNDLSKGTLVGKVKVWNNGSNLYVKYEITETDCYLTEAHVYVGTTKPTTAAPGQFPYTDEFPEGLTSYQFTIPWQTGWACGTGLYVAAHATVCCPGENGGTPGEMQFVQGIIATQTLWAGQNIDAGTVSVAVEGENLVITYETKDGWELTETHLAVAHTLEGIPQTKKGNPIPGQFPYKHENLPGITNDSYTIPLSELMVECDDVLYIAAHASLRKMVSGGEYQTETGWGNGVNFPGKNWATYFTVTIECEPVPPPEPNCETAWAFGNYTFIGEGISTKWGWFFDYTICCE